MKRNVNIYEFTRGTDFIKEVYKEVNTANPSFSQRSFARKLGLDPSTLTRYLAGERHLGFERLPEIGQKLGLNQSEIQYFKFLCIFGDRGDIEPLEIFRRGISMGSLEPSSEEVY